MFFSILLGTYLILMYALVYFDFTFPRAKGAYAVSPLF
jgi:hypothetical protein